MAYKQFEDLPVWKDARSLSRLVYRLTRQATFDEDRGLRDELRENVRSVMSNIAEGFERGSNAEFIQFLGYAKGSAGELRSGSYIALDEEYVTHDDHKRLCDDCKNVSSQLAHFSAFLRSSFLRGSRMKRDDRNTR